MISGKISTDRKPLITIAVADSGGIFQPVEVVLDTGFNGWLTVPPDVIDRLGLIYRGRRDAVLANGQVEEFNIYRARVFWHGRDRSVVVFESGGSPLLGMSLQWGSRVTLDASDGGNVVIEEVTPEPENAGLPIAPPRPA